MLHPTTSCSPGCSDSRGCVFSDDAGWLSQPLTFSQQQHAAVVALVGQLLALHPQLRAARRAINQQLQARIRHLNQRLDQRLDHLVYLLYGLSYAEALVVKPALAQRLNETQYAAGPG